jgi:hypothetical protein
MGMKTYARIENGEVAEIIPPATWGADSPEGVEPPYKATDEVPIEQRFHPSLLDGTISRMADITGIDPQPQQHWTATEASGVWSFSPPDATS